MILRPERGQVSAIGVWGMRFGSTVLLSWRGRQAVAARARGYQALPSQGATSPTLTYIICTTPRSGSYLLCDGLGSTLLAGRPREWFNARGEEIHRSRWGLDRSPDATYGPYLDQVRVRSTTRNGICGIKLHYFQLRTFSNCFNLFSSSLRTLESWDRME
jgi:hypothetical protein